MLIIVSFIILQGFIFAGMVFFLRKIFSRNVTSATSHLEKISADYARKEEEIKKQYEEAKLKSQEIVSSAEKQLQAQREQFLKEAQEEKKRILDNAQNKADEMLRQADGACQALLKEMQWKIDEKALLKAAELLKVVLPEGIRYEIHKKWLEDLITNGLAQLDRLKITDGVTTASIVTAFNLHSHQRDSLQAAISAKLGRQVTLVEKTDPGIIAGLVITVGSLVFDGSLMFKIQEAVRGERSGS